MKKTILFLIGTFWVLALKAQVREITTTGDWSNSATWLNGLIADQSGESVLMQSNTTVTILNGQSYTIGNYTANNANGITIDAGGSLGLSPGSFLAAGNGTTITVNGTFTVNGNFTVQNNVNLIINGSMIVTGNVDMGNNGHLTVSGAVTVGGNFDGGNNTQVTVNASGSVIVAGSVTVDNGSTLGGTGSFQTGGGCTGPTGFCSDSQLPMELLYFQAIPDEAGIRVRWATATEQNVDYFEIQKSVNGFEFFSLATVAATGSSRVKQQYEFTDHDPYVGTAYYRLVEFDHDGASTIFKIAAAQFDGEKKVNIYPNPIQNNELSFSLNFVSEKRINYQVVDVAGKILAAGPSSGYRVSIPIEISPGIYFLIVQCGEIRSIQRFVVQ